MPEAYFFADPGALEATGCTSPSWAIELGLRPYHPKHYLRFLLDPDGYAETQEGLRALGAINWVVVLARAQHTLFLRSLFQDLAFAVGLDQSQFPGEVHPLTSDYRNRNRILRNL